MTYQSEVLADAPVLYWRLDETSGSTVADSSGNSHAGTYFGSPTKGYTGLIASDPSSKALDVTNSDGAQVASGSWLNGWTALSVEVWFNADAVVGLKHLVGRSSWAVAPNASGRQWHLMVHDGQLEFALTFSDGTNNVDVVHGPSLSTGTTYHVVGTWNGSTLKLYVDGSEVYSGSYGSGKTLMSSTEPFRVGAESQGVYGIDGRVSEVAVYDYALSSGRVSAHYAAATGAVGISGTVAATSSVVGSLGTGLSGSVAATSGVSGVLSSPGSGLSGVVAAVSGVSGALFEEDESHDYAPEIADPTPPALSTSRVQVAVATSLPFPTLVDGRPT